MREVGSNSGGVDDIVEGQLVNEVAVLEEQRERLRRTGTSCQLTEKGEQEEEREEEG